MWSTRLTNVVVVATLLENDHWGGGGTGIIERLYDPFAIDIPLPKDIYHR